MTSLAKLQDSKNSFFMFVLYTILIERRVYVGPNWKPLAYMLWAIDRQIARDNIMDSWIN